MDESDMRRRRKKRPANDTKGSQMEKSPGLDMLQKVYEQRPFGIYAVSRQVKKPGERVCYRTAHSAFIFAIAGRARLTFDDDRFLADGGRNAIVHGCPDRSLAFEVLDGRPFEHVNIYYKAGRENGADPDSWMERPYCFQAENHTDLLERVEALEKLGETLSLESRLEQIIGATWLVKTMFAPSPHIHADNKVAQARAYLETCYASPVSLRDLARFAEMSEQHFSRRFYQAYGIRPMSYLTLRRLEQAYRLLQTDMLVKDVAQAVGYDDPFYFSRIFKKHYGYSPQKARGK